MKGFETKLEQAIFINKNGCWFGGSNVPCLKCEFISATCRLYPPETSPEVKKDVKKYIRNEKLKNLKNDN